MDSFAARRAGELVEAMLIAPVLRPMIDGVGMLGDYELDMLAREIAHRDDLGFARILSGHLGAKP